MNRIRTLALATAAVSCLVALTPLQPAPFHPGTPADSGTGSWAGPSALLAAKPPAPTAKGGGVTTVATWPVTSCGSWSCCVAGDLKGTFTVTLGANGMATVKVTLKPTGMSGCGSVSGHISVTTAGLVGQVMTASGPLNFSGPCQYTDAWAGSTFIVNANGSVTVQAMSLSISCFTPDPG